MADDGMPFASVAAQPKATNFQVRRPDTLQFRTLDYKGFPLATSGGPTKGKVTLKPGKYAIYCTIDSHAAQGMEATITVAP